MTTPRKGFLRTVGTTLGVGLAAGALTIFLIPTFTSFGVPERTATVLPNYTFGAGTVWGFAATRADLPRAALRWAVWALVLGALGWILGLLAGALAIVFGVPETVVDWFPKIGFALCLTFAVIIGRVVAYEAIKTRKRS